jgi:hypothetical protein
VFAAAEQAVRGRYDIYSAIGCYVFGLSPRGSARPWPYYVGKACDQALYKRVFQLQDKPNVYDAILTEYAAARPFVYLLPLLTPSGAPARLKSNAKRIRMAEHELIGTALRANVDLWNVQHRAALESFVIDGISAPGRASAAAQLFSEMLELKPYAARTQRGSGSKLGNGDKRGATESGAATVLEPSTEGPLEISS